IYSHVKLQHSIAISSFSFSARASAVSAIALSASLTTSARAFFVFSNASLRLSIVRSTPGSIPPSSFTNSSISFHSFASSSVFNRASYGSIPHLSLNTGHALSEF
ncbi:hypothetical protein PENTCL1PPCAC_12585, partial [Pristionchus entomophagus]